MIKERSHPNNICLFYVRRLGIWDTKPNYCFCSSTVLSKNCARKQIKWSENWNGDSERNNETDVISVASSARTSDTAVLHSDAWWLWSVFPLSEISRKEAIWALFPLSATNGDNKCFVPWQSLLSVVLKYIPPLLSSIWNNEISPQTVIFL